MTDQEDRLLGAEVLDQYITEHYPSVNAFAKEHGFDQSDLSKILAGKRGKNISVQMAAAIETATKGVVQMTMWVPE